MRVVRTVTLFIIFAAFVFAGRSAGYSLRSKSQLRRIPAQAVHKATKVQPDSMEIDKSSQKGDPGLAPEAFAANTEPVESGGTDANSAPWMVTTDGSKSANPPRQNNILLLGVDDLQATQPRLEAAWLVMYITQTPHFTIMPIYPGIPAEDGKATKSDGQLAKLFRSDPVGIPGPGFFSELKDRGLWWSGYFIVDHLALASVIEIVQETTGSEELSANPGQSLLKVPLAWKDPAGARLGQIQVAQAFCEEAALLNANDIGAIDHLFLLFPDHILSDIPREQAAAEMVGMLVHNSPLSCEFPTQSTQPK